MNSVCFDVRTAADGDAVEPFLVKMHIVKFYSDIISDISDSIPVNGKHISGNIAAIGGIQSCIGFFYFGEVEALQGHFHFWIYNDGDGLNAFQAFGQPEYIFLVVIVPAFGMVNFTKEAFTGRREGTCLCWTGDLIPRCSLPHLQGKVVTEREDGEVDLIGAVVSKINVFKGHSSAFISCDIHTALKTEDQSVIGTGIVVDGRHDTIWADSGLSQTRNLKFKF